MDSRICDRRNHSQRSPSFTIRYIPRVIAGDAIQTFFEGAHWGASFFLSQWAKRATTNAFALERGPSYQPMAELLNALQHGSAPLAASLLLSGLVVMLSLVPLGAARSQANFTMADMAAPRAMFERFPAWGKRASWAHQNCFEAFTLHAPACLLALIAGVSAPIAMAAAWLHPLLRLLYIGAYVGNIPPLRGLCWASALLCSGILYLEGLKAVLAG
jgi:uncharacterized MAPEG superfamily protein